MINAWDAPTDQFDKLLIPGKTGLTGRLSKQVPVWERIRELHGQRFGKRT